MGELLIKPYEISVWEDRLTQSGFEEVKLAVIGSDTMTGPNKVYEPVFVKKANGERTLSFSLKYKYFDPYTGNDEIINPFAALLINERKVKLKYDGKWYEFIVKDHTESSDGLVWTYTCTDAFVLELSKTGYNITFDAELNNNQGTAKQLASETLKDTDWRLGGATVGKQLIEEPIYKATLLSKSGITIINASGDNTEVPEAGAQVYVFYSYVKNSNGKFVQFIIRDDNRQYVIDDKKVITDTNFRITTELTFNNNSFWYNGVEILRIGEIETQFHANRLAYSQLTTYDPVMQRTVDRFKFDDREIYRYTENTYTTSNVVMNFITNGDNFNLLDDGTLQGWNPYTEQEFDSENPEERLAVIPLELKTKPELATGKELADITRLSQIEGYLKAYFNGALTQDYENTIFNSGFKDNASFIESIAKGEEFVFRWRAGKGEDLDELTPVQNLGVLVAKYTQDQLDHPGYYYKHIDTENIILQIEGVPQELNNYVKGGYIREENTGEVDSQDQPIIKHNYVIDDVVQTPSTKYIYVDSTNDQQYVWSGLTGDFELLNNNYLPYYYIVGKADKPLTNSVLTDVTEKIGIFIYVTGQDAAGDYYIQDIQLTRHVTDADGQPVLIGNVPTAISNPTEYYYLKPKDNDTAEDIVTYTSTAELLSAIGAQGAVEPIYNEGSEKNLSISVSQSNCFNILQTIAETFECWVDLVVEHDVAGKILIDEDGRPRKYVYLKEYAGKDNYAGFKYAVNLQSIERTVNSDEIVTKLIVDQSQSDYVDEGYVSIANASSNPSGEAYILNFNYYYNQGLLDRTTAESDINGFLSAVKKINSQIQEKEKERRDLELAFTTLGSKRNVYTELVETAQDTKGKALAEFEQLTGQTYEEYSAEHTTLDPDDQLTEEDTVFDILGDIYSSSAVINNYSGLLTNIEQEYWDVRHKLRGTENYNVKIWVDKDESQARHVFVEVNDYLPGFSFTLGGSSYESSVSRRYFDITTNATTINFTAPQGFTITPESTYTINDNEVAKFKITSNNTIPSIEDAINEKIEEKNELTKEFNNKYRRFIQEGTWNSTDYIDSELYYLDALQVSNTSAEPVISYTINVVEISQLDGFEWYSFDAGDKSYVEDTEFFGWTYKDNVLTPAREEVIVSQVEWHLDEPSKNVITVQNYKTRFEDFFQRISAAVQTVQYNEATYAKISTLLDADGTINQNVFRDSINRISGQNYNLTSDGSVRVDGDQIMVVNLTNPANLVKIDSEGIRISSDGGQSWATAISGRGINIGTVYTGQLNTDEVIIGSADNPSFRWDKSGISAYEIDQNNQISNLKTFVRYDQYGLYGIKDNGTFKAQSLQDVKDNAHFAVTWDGFFIRNNYTDGRVEITSDNDFQVIQTIQENGESVDKERIKIGALEFNQQGHPTKYGIRIKNLDDEETFVTGSDGNVTITGTINATGGNFSNLVTVGKDDNDNSKPYIKIDGSSNVDATISSSRYSQDGASYGWMINADGDAVFNNITARGAIKTAVFEYAEIQAVGGIFIFRPSSTIRSAEISGNDLIVTVEKPILFKAGQWCKVSNYLDKNQEAIDTQSILLNNGLTHVYEVSRTQGSNNITLLGGAALVQGDHAVVDNVDKLVGGALVDMGNESGTSNYGIGVNSSDNTVNLPARAISLFETVVDDSRSVKVSYKYRGILGTLPALSYEGNDPQVSMLYHNYLEGTQGIYTDNMYLGDADQYLTFYTDTSDPNNPKKKLRIRASQILFEASDNPGHYDDVSEIEVQQGPEGPAGKDAITVEIDSTAGILFVNDIITSTLVCTVKKGGVDITNDPNYSIYYTWKKRLSNGSGYDTSWGRPLEHGNRIDITSQDVENKGIFECEVIIQEV